MSKTKSNTLHWL